MAYSKTPFPWAVGPSTAPHTAWSRDAGAREAALDFGRLHVDGMAALEKLGAPHGGGLAGILVGVIEAYLAEGLITAPDRTRLIDLFDAFRDPDRARGGSRIAAIHAAAVADPDASPAALAVSSVSASVAAPGPTSIPGAAASSPATPMRRARCSARPAARSARPPPASGPRMLADHLTS